MLQKKKVLFIMISLVLAFYVQGQVGVNTENVDPYLFVLDGASSEQTTDSQTGQITTMQLVDDVIIDKDGHMGVGTVPGNAKLTLNAAQLGGAIKLSDTTEGMYKAFVSLNDDGVGSWSSIGGTWFGALIGTPTNYLATQDIVRKLTTFQTAYSAEANKTTGEIRVPLTGAYRITISGWMSYGRTSAVKPVYYANKLYLYVNGTREAWFTAISEPVWGMDQNFYKVIDLKEGDVLSFYKDETVPNGLYSSGLSFFAEFLY